MLRLKQLKDAKQARKKRKKKKPQNLKKRNKKGGKTGIVSRLVLLFFFGGRASKKADPVDLAQVQNVGAGGDENAARDER